MPSSDPAPLPQQQQQQQQQQVVSQTTVNAGSAVATRTAPSVAATGDAGSDHAVTAQQPPQSQARMATQPNSYPASSSVVQQQNNRKQPPPSSRPASASSSGMGHFPPRQQQLQESRQGSPPTEDSANTANTSSESWNDLTHQFEEAVGKPSRDALHKFFYPPSSPSRQSRRHIRANSHNTGSSRNLSSSVALPALSSPTVTAAPKENTTVVGGLKAESLDNTNSPQVRQTRVPEPPSFSIDDDDENDVNHPAPEQPVVSPSSQQPSSVYRGSPAGLDDNYHNEEQPPIQFQRSFDVQEEQDQKYVERFWTIYDDIIILSLFTQIGVVARLAASAWFTFFDGVFHNDSPLFTNLPLNCLSCFLLGLLGSGDRLMETITTRFTPRQLQQRITVTSNNNINNSVGGSHSNRDSDDSFSTEEEDHDNDGNRHYSGSGLRQRRRPKRAKQHNQNNNHHNGAMNAANATTFHSWEPPLHWHDDLREVQLLALERRIRASKCLILFPVMKEDADVVEHYVGEGYEGSVRQQQQSQQSQRPSAVATNNGDIRERSRRRFGRKKYNAAKLADSDADDGLFHTAGTYSGDEDDFDYKNDGDNDDYSYDTERQNNTSPREDDGRFRFDLKLTPSLESANESVAVQENASPVAAAAAATSPTSVPPSIQKLIKRAPGISTPSPSKAAGSSVEAGAAASSSPTVQPQQPGLTITEKTQPHQGYNASVSPLQQPQSGQMQSPTTPEQTTPQNVSFAAGAVAALAGTPQDSDKDQQSLFEASGGEGEDPQIDQIIANVQANVSENINRMRRVNIADGWDVGTTPESMADDLMLGLRDGFCGALSSFSSWNSSMLHLLREGHIGEAFVGYLLGLQLPIVAYRFGQQSAVYYFVWRCRREARREERKGGYGIRIKMDDDDDDNSDNPLDISVADDCFDDEVKSSTSLDEAMDIEVPSVRAICTALYLLALVTQCTSLKFFSDPQDQQIALSLLFSPVGSLVRWRLSKYNNWRPGFPIGTFICNIVACALSGSLGALLAGNPGPKERILLQSVVAGFGGTLSSLAAFIVEVLAGMDPLLFRFDGVIYATCSIMWALIVGFVFSASEEWADSTA